MPYNGQGVFVPAISFVADQASAIGPQASRFDTDFNDVATGLSNAICRDGQTTVTANISLSNKKITNLADGTSGQDAVNVRIVQQASKFMFCGGSGSGSAITGTTTPSFPALVVGMLIMVVAPADSQDGGCTFAVNGLAAQQILWPSGVVSGDFKANDTLLLLWDGSNYRWINRWRHSDIPPTTIIPMLMLSAPVGWTQLTDASWNDRVPLISTGLGQQQGGSWVIAGLSNETAAHQHDVVGTTGAPNQTVNYQGPAGGGAISAGPTHAHAIAITSSSENALHTHVGNAAWRPAYATMILCSRDT